MSCRHTIETQSLLDTELDPARTGPAERHLESCAECRELRDRNSSLRDLLHAHATRYRAPDGLASQIGALLDKENPPHISAPRKTRRSFWLGAAGGTAITALAAGLAFLILLPPSAGSLLEAVTDAHTNALLSGHVIAVASSDHHTVKPWFAGRVPVSPPVADFRENGFALTGGRVETIEGAQAAVVVYRHAAHEIDLFVWADRGARLPAAGLRHGYRSVFWKSGDLDFAAVSDMQGAELERFVTLVKGERE